MKTSVKFGPIFTALPAPLFLAVITLLTGCSVMSTNVLKEVDRSVTVPVVQADPGRFTGSRVLWGGFIISSENREDSTVIEVLATRLDSSDLPMPAGEKTGTAGRFLIEAPGFLDTVIFTADKGITVAGTVKGLRKELIGRMKYPYPVVAPIEIHLMNRTRIDYYELPPWGYYPYYGDPYYPYYWPYYPRTPWYYPGYYP